MRVRAVVAGLGSGSREGNGKQTNAPAERVAGPEVRQGRAMAQAPRDGGLAPVGQGAPYLRQGGQDPGSGRAAATGKRGCRRDEGA